MTIIDLLLHIHKQILDARLSKDTIALNKIWRTVDLILEVAYETKDRDVASLLEDMRDSIRDSLMGEDWKSEFPTEEQIKELDKKRKKEII